MSFEEKVRIDIEEEGSESERYRQISFWSFAAGALFAGGAVLRAYGGHKVDPAVETFASVGMFGIGRVYLEDAVNHARRQAALVGALTQHLLANPPAEAPPASEAHDPRDLRGW